MAFEKERSLQEILEGMISSQNWESKLHETKIRKLWTKKMGTTINTYTRELRLRDHKLFISIDSAPLKQELLMNKEKIKKMVNAELGGNFVKDVIVR